MGNADMDISLPSNRCFQFKKYTLCGNTFLIIDESSNSFDDDKQRAYFSRWALDKNFGIGGADNVLFIKSLNSQCSDYTFRIFEYNGVETLLCGNGLLSVADMLYRSTGRPTFNMLTSLPTGSPRNVEVGVEEMTNSAWANLGFPSSIPKDLYSQASSSLSQGINYIDSLNLSFPYEKEWAAGLSKNITFSGNFIFTGEPHLVFLLGYGLSPELEKKIWINSEDQDDSQLSRYSLMRMSEKLVHYIGRSINSKYQELFPQGVHINFARINKEEGTIEYRTYERAINCETLACGSGAVAVANVCWITGLLKRDLVTVLPHRACWYRPNSKIEVRNILEGSILSGYPELIYEGTINEFL